MWSSRYGLAPAPASALDLFGDRDLDWADRALSALLVVVLAFAAYRLWRLALGRILARIRRDGDELDTQVLARRKRRETARTVLEQTGKYVIAIVAGFIALGQLFDEATFGLAGASLLAVVLGFASQTLLKDVIAGCFIIFEGQYAVGDFVHLAPMNAEGVVEDLGLRTTVVRNLNGDRIHVPNGFIQAATLPERGFRTYTVDLVTHQPEALIAKLRALFATIPEDLYVRSPRLSPPAPIDDRTHIVRVDCVVPPSMEWLVEKLLVGRIAEEAGDLLAVEPVAYTVDLTRLRQYERWLLVR
jgi:small conductance mechanosensitive channel